MAAAFKNALPGFGSTSTAKADVLGPLVVELQTRLGTVEDDIAGNVDIATNAAAIATLQTEVETATTGLLDRATALESAKTTDEATIATHTTRIAQLQQSFTMLVPISFETAEQGTTKVYFPTKATINKLRAFINLAVAGTDAGTITLNNAASAAMAGGSVSIPASSAFGYQPVAAVPTTNNVVTAGTNIEVVTAKTTAGGRGFVEIEYTITP